jgi:hypothetical protein
LFVLSDLFFGDYVSPVISRDLCVTSCCINHRHIAILCNHGSIDILRDRGDRCNNKQARQWTYDVTLRLVRAAIVAAVKQYVLNIMSVCLFCVYCCLIYIHHAVRMRHIVI